ncbi:MAG TPA: SPOR domain-containing protein [Methylococcus sp.]|nr:SPOR domain-containing protein [Methylococcus sp.]
MDEQLKQRLIGVSIIVALVVIFVPMLFDKKPDDPSSTEIAEIPPLPKDFEEKPMELPRTVEDVTAASKEPETPGYRIIPITEEPEDEAETATGQAPITGTGRKSEPKGKAGKTAAPATTDEEEDFGREDLEPAGSTPAGAAKPSPGTRAKPPVKPATPPSAGKSAAKPATPPSAATEAQARKPDQGTTPSAWIVQAGAFTLEANAKSLVDKLRQNKMPAFMETVQGGSGKTVYYVKIGPNPNRAAAEKTLQQLEAVTGIRGYLRPHRAP